MDDSFGGLEIFAYDSHNTIKDSIRLSIILVLQDILRNVE